MCFTILLTSQLVPPKCPIPPTCRIPRDPPQRRPYYFRIFHPCVVNQPAGYYSRFAIILRLLFTFSDEDVRSRMCGRENFILVS